MSERKAFVKKFAQGYGFERTAPLCWRENGSAGADSFWGLRARQGERARGRRPRRVDARERIRTIASEASVKIRPAGANFFFCKVMPDPFGSGIGWLALTGLEWVKCDNLSYFGIVAGCDLQTHIKRETPVRVFVGHAFGRVFVDYWRGLLVSVCVKD